MLAKIQETIHHFLTNSFLSKHKLFYDFGILFYGIGIISHFTFSFFGIGWFVLILGMIFILSSEKNLTIKLLTLFIFPILVIISFIILLFSGGNEFVFLLFALLLTFPFLAKIFFWIGKSNTRINSSIVIIVTLIITRVLFFAFSEMKVIQSKIYPNLYLIDNVSSNQDSLQSLIKKISTERLNTDFIGS